MQGGECEPYTVAYRVLRFRMAWCDAISSIRFPWKSLRIKIIATQHHYDT